jgi:capsular polysaccharide biosynthesis protein
MENNTQSTKSADFSADSLILLLWKWRKSLLIVIGLATVTSVVAALMIREKFKSTAIVFPAKASSVTLGEKVVTASGMTMFGEEEEAEQMLQLLNSAEIRNHIIKKFNLAKHYEIDAESKFKNTELVSMYNGLVTCSRTRYGSITIDVSDWSRDTAAFMANEIANYFDSVKNRMLQENALHNFKIIEREYNNMETQISRIVDTLAKLRTLGVVGDAESQAALLQGYSDALATGKTMVAEKLLQQLESNRKYGSSYITFIAQLEHISKRREILRGNYDQLKSDATNNVAHKYVVEWATPAEKKSYPVRWLIVAVSLTAAFFFMVVLILIIEKIKELRKKAI